MAEELTVGEVHEMLRQHLSKRSDLGIWNAVVTQVLCSRNPFEPESARKPQPWFVLFSTLLLVAIVFCCLPADQRYYLLIMPLLLVVLLRGFLHMPAPFRLGVLLLPVLLLSISIPAAIESHSDPAPPIKLVRFLQQRYPPEQRRDVLLFLAHCQRHFKWYAPEFTVFDDVPSSAVQLERLNNAKAIYTDEPRLARSPGWQLVLATEFSRSVVIYGKHHDVRLYRVEKVIAP